MIGAAFVPIDNDQPEIRADKILEIAKIKCLIGEKEETHKYREKYKWIDKDSVILKRVMMRLLMTTLMMWHM